MTVESKPGPLIVMTTTPLLEHVALVALAAVTVSLWTVRVALTARGRRSAAALAATVESMLFASVFAQVLDSIDSPTRLVAYGLGVGVGSLAGLALDTRLDASSGGARNHRVEQEQKRHAAATR